MAMNLNNPIAYGKYIASENIDSLNRAAIAEVEVFNGNLVTLGEMNTGVTADAGYCFNAVPTTANTAVNVWMVREPEVPHTPCANIYIDPRAYSAKAGETFNVFRPMPTDVIHVSNTAFAEGSDPATVSGDYVTAGANGQLIAVTSATGVAGVVFKVIGEEAIPVGQEFVPGYLLECIQNPQEALA